MGKSDERQLPLHQQQQGGRNGSGVSRIFCCCCEGCPVGVSRIFRRFNFKCVFVLLLSVAVLLSAVFWVFPRRSNQSGFDAKEAIKLSSDECIAIVVVGFSRIDHGSERIFTFHFKVFGFVFR
nr:leucine-rich repeat extensin-like protein 2 [Ipomoea batatas]